MQKEMKGGENMENTKEANGQKEEEKTEGAEKSGANANSDDGEHAELDLIKRAEKANEEMKKNLEQKQKLIEREEKLATRQEALKALGGGSLAGARPEKKEETPAEYTARIMKGGTI